jgi:hypothetical protein
MRLHAIEQAGDALPALVGHQRHAMPAPHQLGGERMGRHHVAAGAAGGEHEMPGHASNTAAHQRLLHFTT